MTDLRKIRTAKRLTQQEAADRIGVSLRSYISYENDETKMGSVKYRFLLHELEKIDPIDEEHGVLPQEVIAMVKKSVHGNKNSFLFFITMSPPFIMFYLLRRMVRWKFLNCHFLF